MVVPPQRDGGQRQYIDLPVPNCEADSLAPLLTWMREHLAEEQPVRVLARRAAMSERTFARRFAAETGTTPGKWLLAQRLHHARTLLESSDLAVETVASRAGFGSAALLRHHFGTARRRGAGGVPPYVPHPGRARRLSDPFHSRVAAMTYPPAPWNMHGQLWLSLFRVRDGDHPDREPGVYGAALVSYEQPSPLTYSELLVARPVKQAGGRRVNITDIWVDSPDSLRRRARAVGDPQGPVRLRADDHRRPGAAHRVEHHAWTARRSRRRASPTSRGVVPRTPFKGSTWQQRAADEPRRRTARSSPTSRAAPRRCRAAGRGTSTSQGRSPGWQASDPSRRSG